ncbi:MAG: dephospho-CoA kinase [Chitinophagia bacterium]|jgi:dephospho-CoA kinase
MAAIIGLTGGIGAGKTTVAQVFKTLGIPVFNADEVAKQLMQNSPIIKAQLIATFGDKVYAATGELDKTYLAGLVFKDAYQLELLNAIVHPVTIQAAKDWAATQTTPYVIKEAALLFESAAAEGMTAVIGVAAPINLRIQRVMQRDACTKIEVEQRMRNQISDAIKLKLCDWVIENNDQDLMIPQVLKIQEAILAKLATL